jgi:hypothetical protein
MCVCIFVPSVVSCEEKDTHTIYIYIALSYRVDDWGFESRQGLGIFLFTTGSRQALGPHSLLSDGYKGYFPGVRRPGRDADHSSTSSAEVKNAWSYTSTPQYAFIAWCSVKVQGQIYLCIVGPIQTGDQIKENKKSGHGRDEKCIQNFSW